MAVTFMTGFEAQQAATDNITLAGTTQSYSTAQHRTGAASLRCNPASGASGFITFTVTADQWLHFGLYVATMPSVQRVIGHVPGTTVPNLRLNSNGTLAYYNNTTLKATTAAALSTNTWYWVGFRQLGSASDEQLIEVDGVFTNGTPGTLTSGITQRLGVSGTEASAIDIYIDDVVLDNAAFLDPSNVDFALPISDNTVTAVTGGAGGTTNLWDAVNNTPPAGVASASETNTTNIRFPASATESYIADLETYTTLGVGASDTIIATRGVIRHGEDIATGTKNGTYVGTTNPTQTDSTAFTFGGDAGAHAAEVGLWVTLSGTIKTTSLPTSGDYGTSPTIQVDRASQSRVGCVDFMGLLVAWTPSGVAAADQPSKRVQYIQLLPSRKEA